MEATKLDWWHRKDEETFNDVALKQVTNLLHMAKIRVQ